MAEDAAESGERKRPHYYFIPPPSIAILEQTRNHAGRAIKFCPYGCRLLPPNLNVISSDLQISAAIDAKTRWYTDLTDGDGSLRIDPSKSVTSRLIRVPLGHSRLVINPSSSRLPNLRIRPKLFQVSL